MPAVDLLSNKKPDAPAPGTTLKWRDLDPEAAMVAALEKAGSFSAANSQNEKRRWSELFADQCAMMIADSVRSIECVRKKIVLPDAQTLRTEPLVPLNSSTSKSIDVIVADRFLGLEVGFSLKGLNTPDGKSGNYDKNLTGRLYEMSSEVSLVHKHLPQSRMIGIIFMPLESTTDKTDRAPSSFANAVLKLREMSGRLHPGIKDDNGLCDRGFVGLYAKDDVDEIQKGAIRFFDVSMSPPKKGRPIIIDTFSLDEMTTICCSRSNNLNTWALCE
ncbi:hypothetical protein P5704_024550 (plasmid) [Pseudomonas sp. FeN3W]|nr:hypothetical protein P5704_024550 [Pseudomonas sp. FeN3W]